VIAAKAAGKALTEKTLKAYKDTLDESFVMKDLKKYRHMPDVLEKSPQFFTTYPGLVNRAAKTMFTVDGIDKMTKQREVMGSFKSARKLTGLVGDAIKIWRATR